MNWKRIFYLSGFSLIAGLILIFTAGYRGVRVYRDATEVLNNVKYLVESGETIGTQEAESALSATYLEIMFGDNPELFEQLKLAVEKGMRDMPDVSKGEVSAIVVTYRKNGDDKIEDVVAHIMGEFPLGRRPISMHRDGFFANQIDEALWTTGDASIRFLGRDMVVWANNEESELAQRELIEAIFSGEVIILADSIVKKPIYYTAVLPAPKQALPLRMRPHVRAIIINGVLAPANGAMEMIVLTDSERAASRVSSMIYDLKLSAQIALRTRFRGVTEETAWNPQYVPVWWAYEMANTLEDAELSRRDRTVRISSQYERVMVNAILKSIERFGRDYSQIKGVQEEKLDPRVVDARMKSSKPAHYWSEAHKWGPDWPISASTNIFIQSPDQPGRELNGGPPVTETL